MPAGLGTLFVGLLLIVLAFVEGDSVWKSAHQILFGKPSGWRLLYQRKQSAGGLSA